MIRYLASVAILASVLRAGAGDLAQSSTFGSVEAFVEAVAAFHPATTKSDISPLFTVRELGQSDDPKIGASIAAASIESASALWSNDSHAFVFVTANPPTEATRSAVGVLFLLSRIEGSWRITDHRRFTATGKEAQVSAELTASAGVSYRLGSDGMKPVMTIKESQGGRGYDYQVSASYSLQEGKIRRLELE